MAWGVRGVDVWILELLFFLHVIDDTVGKSNVPYLVQHVYVVSVYRHDTYDDIIDTSNGLLVVITRVNQFPS